MSLEDRLPGLLGSARGPTDSPRDVYRRLQLVARLMGAAPAEGPTGPRLMWLADGDEPSCLAIADFASVQIGRDPRCDILLADPRASRRHAEVKRAGSASEIIDLHSGSGTWLNGIRLEAARRLKDGDVIDVQGRALVYFSE